VDVTSVKENFTIAVQIVFFNQLITFKPGLPPILRPERRQIDRGSRFISRTKMSENLLYRVLGAKRDKSVNSGSSGRKIGGNPGFNIVNTLAP